MRVTSVKAALFILIFLFVTPVSAQIARGTVVDSGTGEPLSGSFVLLLDEEENRVGAALADSQGRFIIRAPVPGNYRLRIELIGFATTSTPSFNLASGQTSDHHIPVTIEPVRLEGITATGEGRCRTPRRGHVRALGRGEESSLDIRMGSVGPRCTLPNDELGT
jgi:hypothetical protein